MQNEVLGERYQLQDPIGRGGMATIYRGRDMRMERTVAVKVLREVYSTDPKFVTRFQREAKAASALQHPNIVQVYDYGQSNGSYFIVMELIEGADLRRYLRSRGVLAIDRAIIIAHDVALGLGAAHRRNIVHRDVKPQNVLVGRDGSIKLTDFGIASVYKDINAERLTTTGMTLGTVQYYAPEQAQGEIVSPAADVYALGIVMYEMLTGRTPFDGDTPVAVAMQHIQDAPIAPTQYNPNIPQVLEDIILRCLEKVPEMRYRDGSSLARALEVLGEEEMGEQIPSKLSSGGLKTAASASAFSTVPQRPANSGGRMNNEPQPIALKGVSSPNNFIAPNTQNVQNGKTTNLNEDLANSATIAERPVNPNGFTNVPPVPAVPEQQTYVANNGRGGSLSGFGQGSSPQNFNQQTPYYPPPDAGTTRPFQRGTVPSPGVVQQDQKESRFATIVTVLILLATLLLLGFSIFLAGQLGFIHMPGLGDTGPQQTATASAQGKTVPDLKNLSLTDAQAKAKLSGFTVEVHSGPPNNSVVEKQDLTPGDTTIKRVILVDMKSLASPTPSTAIPNNLVNLTYTDAIDKLRGAGYNNYVLINAGPNPNGDTVGLTVKGTDPDAGVPTPTSQQIKIYVYNCGKSVCAVGTPVVVPTTAPPTATPTTPPTATPTTAPPTPTPTTALPTATPTTPPPTVAPTPGKTPTR